MRGTQGILVSLYSISPSSSPSSCDMFGPQLMAFGAMSLFFQFAERTLKCEFPIDVLSLFKSLSSSSPLSLPFFSSV